jgi:hypothetical protein
MPVATEDLTADEWWHQRIAELKQEYDTDDVWDIPRPVWHEAQAQHAERMRVEHGRDPKTAEKTPERVKAERVVKDVRMEAPPPRRPTSAELREGAAGLEGLDVNQDMVKRAMKGIVTPGKGE